MANETLGLSPLQLAKRIQRMIPQINERWISTVREAIPAARTKTPTYLRDHVPEVLQDIANALREPKSVSHFLKAIDLGSRHGKQRAQIQDYSLQDITTEYSLLRETILDVAAADQMLDRTTLNILCRLIETSISHSAEEFIFNSEQHLRERRRFQLNQIIDSVKDVVYILDDQCRFTAFNARAAQSTGVSRESVLGRSVFDLFPSIVEKPIGNAIRQAISEQKTLYVEDYSPDFSAWLRARFYPSDLGLLVYYDDISELHNARKVVENQQKWLESVLDRLPVGLTMTEPSTGDLIFSNKIAHTLFHRFIHAGHPSAHGESPDVTDLKGQKYSAGAIPSLRAARGEKIHDEEVIWTTANGKLYVNINADIIEPLYGHDQTMITTLQDISSMKEIERTLKESEERFRATFNYTSIGVTLSTMEGKFLAANPAFAALLGYTQEEILNLSIPQVTHPEHLPNTLAQIQRLISGEVPAFKIEKRYIRKDGSEVWAQSTVSATRDEYGQPQNIVAVTEDISERLAAQQALKASEDRYRFASRATRDAIWDWDLKTDKVIWNEALSETLGHPTSAQESTATWWYSHIHPEDQDRVIKDVHQLIRNAGERWSDRYRFQKGDGNYAEVVDRGYIITDTNGVAIRMIGAMQDITQQKNFEAALVEAKNQAEMANQLKTSFLANMSHEIRTPLAAILGFTDLLRNPAISADEHQQFLDVISRNGKALTRIIDDILDLSKVESGRLEIEKIEFSLHSLLEEVTDLFKEKTRGKNIYLKQEIDVGVPDRILSDPSRLRQIMINLVGNAVKFTDQGGITISLHGEPSRGGRLQLSLRIKDTGVGLTSEQQRKLFQPFTQADNTMTRKFGGTGLGLALSRRLARALGGDITIEDCAFGKGCTFVVHFEAERAKHAPAPSAPAASNTNRSLPLAGVKVLLAEDSIDNQFLVSRILKQNGAAVDTANDGAEAINKAQHGDYNLVLMDIQMPRVDGYEATATLRKAGFKKPIIALTAHAMAEEREKTRAVGCNDHLTKPLNPSALLETVARFVSLPLH